MKIVINACFGGFSISKEAAVFMAKRGNKEAIRDLEEKDFYGFDYIRTDPDLIATVEILGEKANGGCANLKVIEIPDGTDWEIEVYDGWESVHEQHESWG